MRGQSFYDFAGVPREDGFFFTPHSPFLGVFDGCSEPWWLPEHPPIEYPGGLTGGQVVSKTCHRVLASATPQDELRPVILTANEIVAELQEKYGGPAVSLSDASTLANASFSFVKVLDEKAGLVEAIWGADVFTILRTTSDEVTIVGGDNRECDLEREELYKGLVVVKGGEGKREYFRDVYPGLKRKEENVKFAVLNGSPAIEHCWNVLCVDNVNLLIVLSDGAWIPIERWGENLAMAKEFVSRFERNGLADTINNWVRPMQQAGIASARAQRPEATALAVSLG